MGIGDPPVFGRPGPTARRENGRWAKKTSCGYRRSHAVSCWAWSPIVPVSGLAVPPYRQRQVGGRVIGPVPSTPLWSRDGCTAGETLVWEDALGVGDIYDI